VYGSLGFILIPAAPRRGTGIVCESQLERRSPGVFGFIIENKGFVGINKGLGGGKCRYISIPAPLLPQPGRLRGGEAEGEAEMKSSDGHIP